MSAISGEDLRAAVEGGVISERQAAELAAFARARAGARAALEADDEPFELVRGFAEIFIFVGIVAVFFGLTSALLPERSYRGLVDGAIGLYHRQSVVLNLARVAVALALAEFFVRRRRMSVAGISLAVVIGWSAASGAASAAWLLAPPPFAPVDGELKPGVLPFAAFGSVYPLGAMLAGGLAAFLAALAYLARYRTPFANFVAGCAAFASAVCFAALLDPGAYAAVIENGPRAIFDIAAGGTLAAAMLVVGAGAFALALHLDMRDPHRVSPVSASAFWIHLVAAPAIVNTVAITLLAAQALIGVIGLVVFLALMGVVSLVIDRRSLLVSGFGYMIALMALAIEDAETMRSVIPLVLGAFVLTLGAFWTDLRGRLMRALPQFPGKTRLPPYIEAA